jgi:hypothetical protein
MTTKIWTKPQTQVSIKQLRGAGYTVNKTPQGYEARDAEGKVVFRALNGSRGYIVTHDEGLFHYADA